jgi:hypothetical protein
MAIKLRLLYGFATSSVPFSTVSPVFLAAFLVVSAAAFAAFLVPEAVASTAFSGP